MYLLPSTILYTNCIDVATWTELSTEKYILGVSQTLQNGGTYPKLQVVKKDGYYFTLNDAKLQLYRYLEKIGQCGRVEVERVSLREVPEGIRKLMIVPDTPITSKVKSTKKNKGLGKYQSVDSSEKNKTCLLAHSNDADDDDDDVDDDDDDDDYISGSEADSDEDSSDWSEEEPSDTDVDSTAEEEQNGFKPVIQQETESFI